MMDNRATRRHPAKKFTVAPSLGSQAIAKGEATDTRLLLGMSIVGESVKRNDNMKAEDAFFTGLAIGAKIALLSPGKGQDLVRIANAAAGAVRGVEPEKIDEVIDSLARQIMNP